jgi:hypothetical protein
LLILIALLLALDCVLDLARLNLQALAFGVPPVRGTHHPNGLLPLNRYPSAPRGGRSMLHSL